jgi:hypothetical protein
MVLGKGSGDPHKAGIADAKIGAQDADITLVPSLPRASQSPADAVPARP